MEIITAMGKGLSSHAIKLFTGGDISHVALRYGGAESDWMVHSTIGGVQPEWWFHFKKAYPRRSRFKVLFSDGDRALDLVVNHLAHKNYDYRGFLGQGIAILFGWQKNPFSNKRHFRCTELLTEWHRYCNELNKELRIAYFDPEMSTPVEYEKYYRMRTDLFQEMQGDSD